MLLITEMILKNSKAAWNHKNISYIKLVERDNNSKHGDDFEEFEGEKFR